MVVVAARGRACAVGSVAVWLLHSPVAASVWPEERKNREGSNSWYNDNEIVPEKLYMMVIGASVSV